MPSRNDCAYSDSVVTEYQVKKHIKQLKPGCALGFDGISPEHVKYGVNAVLPVLLSHLFIVCIQYGLCQRVSLRDYSFQY